MVIGINMPDNIISGFIRRPRWSWDRFRFNKLLVVLS